MSLNKSLVKCVQVNKHLRKVLLSAHRVKQENMHLVVEALKYVKIALLERLVQMVRLRVQIVQLATTQM